MKPDLILIAILVSLVIGIAWAFKSVDDIKHTKNQRKNKIKKN